MYLARALGPEATVLVFDAYSSLRSKQQRGACRICSGRDDLLSQNTSSFDCQQWFSEHAIQHTDYLLAIGSGGLWRCKTICRKRLKAIAKTNETFTSPREIGYSLSQNWVGPKTKLAYMPISSHTAILQNKIGNFDVILHDDQWIKPPHIDQQPEFRRICKSRERTNTLVYVGRFARR